MPKRKEKFAPLHLSLSPTLFSRMMSESSSFSYIRYMKKKKCEKNQTASVLQADHGVWFYLRSRAKMFT